ncbi:hypothetical protein [Halobacillus sp. Cin3]|uniref:hypothetical protein n=1 Tax=Halobacillus sp. Cin3 TaxID=2928441 RepID=UPI00248F3771|nr:hypothetical protein [Halobacillus sp. Cin3]
MIKKHLLPLNLQFFAYESGDQADQTADTSGGQDQQQQNQQQDQQTGTATDQQAVENTFTQDDVSKISAKEAKKAQEKLLKQLGIEDFDNAKEGMKKFREWQDSQKTEAEKKEEALNNLERDKGTLSKENNSLKAQLSAVRSGVKDESIEDVVALAERQVTEDTSMEEAIKQVVEKYPSFKNSDDGEEKPSFTTGQHQKQGSGDAFAKTLLGK